MNTQEGLYCLDREFIYYSSWVDLQELYGGHPVPGAKYDAQLRNLMRICREMYEAGAKIHTFYLSTGWKAPGVFDYSETDRILKAFFEACPDALLIPRITSFDSTPEWERTYPDDLYLYENAKDSTTEEIRSYYRTVQDTIYETALIGAPYDFYRMDDLETLDLSRYKLVIFLNAVGMNPERFRKLGFSKNARFLWNFMPGGSFGEAEAICGMKLRETGHEDGFPLLAIDPVEGLEVIHTYADPTLDIQADKAPFVFPPYTMEHSDNPYRVHNLPDGSLIRTAKLGRHCVCTVPSLDRFAIRALAEEAGCGFDAEVGTAVYADDRFTAYMSADRADIVLND